MMDTSTSAAMQPVCFRVTAIASEAKIADDFVGWMRREHGPDLLKQDGCQEYRVLRLNTATVICEYVFSTRNQLDYYVEHHAPALRARGRELFPERVMTFEREVLPIEAMDKRDA